MKSISFSKTEFNKSLCYEVWTCIHQYRFYFRKISNGRDSNELMMDVFDHMMEHYNPECGQILPYMLTLARTMSKTSNKDIPCDFLEDTLADALDEQLNSEIKDDSEMLETVSVRIDTTDSQMISVIKLALSFMNFFNMMCEALINRDSTTRYFPDPYIKSCLRLSNRCGAEKFNRLCLDLYRGYKSKFNWFLGSLDCDSSWRELDSGLVSKNESKRIRLLKKGTNIECSDPDTEEWEVSGVLRDKKIFKVPYQKVRKQVLAMVNANEISPLKFIIGDTYICRSLGGSLSVINAPFSSQEEVFKLEVLTNCIHDLYARYLAWGSECVYMLASPRSDGSFAKIPFRLVGGIALDFSAIDVTP